MAYSFESRLGDEHSKSVELTSCSYSKWHSFRNSYLQDVLKGKMIYPPKLIDGFKFPTPNFIPKIDCGYKAKAFGDFMPSIPGMAITQTIVDIIEDIEPNVHQYFPIEFVLRSGEVQPEPYYLLNVCTRISTLHLDNENLDVKYLPEARKHLFPHNVYRVVGPARSTFRSRDFSKPPLLTLRKEKVQGRALWGEYGYMTLFSDIFAKRLASTSAFKHYYLTLKVGEK